MSTQMLWILIPIAGVTVATGIAMLRLVLRLREVRRRAEGAEARIGSYLVVIEKLSGALGAGARVAAGTAPEEGVRPPADSRYLFVSFEEEIRRARRQGRPLTVVILDLGGGGAAAGAVPGSSSPLLRRVALALRGQMRGCDTCLRYADDEFILVLPGVSRQEARKVEDRLRTALKTLFAGTLETRAIPIHPGLGSATFPEDGADFDRLITVADARRLQDREAEDSRPDDRDRRTPLLPLQPRSPTPN